MGNKGLFPGVAVPLAFFCTLFFRHRKKSVSAPWDGQSLSAPESARQSPPRGISCGKVVSCHASRVAFRSPPCTPFGSPTEAIARPIGLQALLPRRGDLLTAKLSPIAASRGLSSGQTIGAARTAVRSACCLPERPGTRFPPVPQFPPFRRNEPFPQ